MEKKIEPKKNEKLMKNQNRKNQGKKYRFTTLAEKGRKKEKDKKYQKLTISLFFNALF